jgi:hypothetical protein
MFTNVSLFVTSDGEICDVWDIAVAGCASFAVGGTIMQVTACEWRFDEYNEPVFFSLANDVVTLGTPITDQQTVVRVLTHWLNDTE